MTRVRAALWAVTIAVLSMALGAVAFRYAHPPVWVAFFAAVFVVPAVVSLLVEMPRTVAAAGGALAAIFVAALLGLTIAVAPVGPDAHRPGLADVVGKPMLGALAAVAISALVAWAGGALGGYVSRRRRGSGPVSGPTV